MVSESRQNWKNLLSTGTRRRRCHYVVLTYWRRFNVHTTLFELYELVVIADWDVFGVN